MKTIVCDVINVPLKIVGYALIVGYMLGPLRPVWRLVKKSGLA